MITPPGVVKKSGTLYRLDLSALVRAEDTGVSQVTWHGIEVGKYGCRRSTLEAMAEVVGMRLDIDLKRKRTD